MPDRSEKRSPKAIEFAPDQRATANEFAQKVWQMVRGRRCRNQKFRREVPIPPYTVDFCCFDLKLIIEVDGEHHLTEDGRLHDQRRDQFLAAQGYRVLRIPGYEVLRDGGGVLKLIEETIDLHVGELQAPSPPAPLPQGGEGSQDLDVPASLVNGGEGSQSLEMATPLVHPGEGSQKCGSPNLAAQDGVKFEIIEDQMAEFLRRKTDLQRLRSVDGFWRSARAILRAAIVTEHPDWDRSRVNVEISKRISNGAVDDARTN